MISLSINLNKIALIRNSRTGDYPSVVEHAQRCIDAGCHGITVHPRPDQRHIRPSDCAALAQLCKTSPRIEFNIEGNPFAEAEKGYPGFMALVEATRPNQCTLVPDHSDQLTSDHGFDLFTAGDSLKPIIQQLQEWGIRVSLFMDPEVTQIEEAKRIGADRIELYTGPFAEAFKQQNHSMDSQHCLKTLFRQHVEAAECAHTLGLGVNAGHDLNLLNLVLYRSLPHLQEVSIGHAFTVDSLQFGMTEAVHRYLDVLQVNP